MNDPEWGLMNMVLDRLNQLQREIQATGNMELFDRSEDLRDAVLKLRREIDTR